MPEAFDAELQRAHGKVHDAAKQEILRMRSKGDDARAAVLTRALTAWARELAAFAVGLPGEEQSNNVVPLARKVRT